MDGLSKGNRITAQWKLDNLSEFNADIIAVFIPKEKWMREGAGGYAPTNETNEMIILKDTENLDWLIFATIHEICHTLQQMTRQEDKTHFYNPNGWNRGEGLQELKPLLEYIQFELL